MQSPTFYDLFGSNSAKSKEPLVRYAGNESLVFPLEDCLIIIDP